MCWISLFCFVPILERWSGFYNEDRQHLCVYSCPLNVLMFLFCFVFPPLFRAKYHKLKYGTELNQGDMKPPNYDSGKNLLRMSSLLTTQLCSTKLNYGLYKCCSDGWWNMSLRRSSGNRHNKVPSVLIHKPSILPSIICSELRRREFLTPAVLNIAFRRRVFTFKSNFKADLSLLYINSYVEWALVVVYCIQLCSVVVRKWLCKRWFPMVAIKWVCEYWDR